MRLLLDTHVFLWLLADPKRLGAHVEVLADPGNDLFVSAASSWEIAIKVSLGRLTLPDDARRYVPDRMRAIGAEPFRSSTPTPSPSRVWSRCTGTPSTAS